MKIYTRTGDKGTTSLVGGTRVSKASVRLEAYGTADELNSHIGLLLAMDGIPEDDRTILLRTQSLLFNLGSRLATEPDCKYQPKGITPDNVAMLEEAIDRITAILPKKFQFVLPGGTMAASQAHVARTVARRCERRMVEMQEQGAPVDDLEMQFINRLSDYLFALAREINISQKIDEIFWDKDC